MHTMQSPKNVSRHPTMLWSLHGVFGQKKLLSDGCASYSVTYLVVINYRTYHVKYGQLL